MWVGGIRMSTTATSGRVRATIREQAVGILGLTEDLDAGLGEQRTIPSRVSMHVLGDDYSHGISASNLLTSAGIPLHDQSAADGARLDRPREFIEILARPAGRLDTSSVRSVADAGRRGSRAKAAGSRAAECDGLRCTATR